MKKITKQNIFFFILGLIIAGSVAVVAVNLTASTISFEPDDDDWEVETVQEALNDLYTEKETDFSKLELVSNNTASHSSLTIQPSTYKFFIITETLWNSSGKIYNTGINWLAINTISNASYYVSGLTGKDGSSSGVAARSYVIVPDGSGNTISITFNNTVDSTSVYGLK